MLAYAGAKTEEMDMASNPEQLRHLITEYISVVTDIFETTKTEKGRNALQKLYEDFRESGTSASECNSLMYEMVRERLMSDGKVNDSMSETQIDWIIFTNPIVITASY